MKQLSIIALLALLMATGCVGQNSTKNSDDEKQATTAPKVTFAELYDYRIVADYPHSDNSYTQGLQYADGTMWEGTGQEGRSHLQSISLATGKVDIVASLPKEEFGEGITIYKDRIYQLTWLSRKAYIYDLNGKQLRTLAYEGEGWGITTDGERLFMSDGTSTIREVNPETLATERSINVTLDGQPLNHINELEWANGYIWANVYLTDSIVKINPETGIVEGYVDLPALRGFLKNNPQAEAFNGVAYNSENGHFYVTGKDWNKLFEIEIIE
jgi:glutamine cyclotransferase